MFVCILPLSTGFGYAETATDKTIGFGGEAQFRTYVFGQTGKVTITVTEKPEHWRVTASPLEIKFPVSQGKRLKTPSGTKQAQPVTVTVAAPTDVSPGTYAVRLLMRQHRSGEETGYNQSSSIQFRQVQPVSYTITVQSPEQGEEKSIIEQVQEQINSAGSAIQNIVSDIVNRNNSADAEQRDNDSKQENSGDKDRDREGSEDQTGQDTGSQQDPNTQPTGKISSGSSTVNWVVFAMIWAVVVGYVVYRRGGKQEEELSWDHDLEKL